MPVLQGRIQVVPGSVVSDGTKGPEWINRLTKPRAGVSEPAKNVLRSNGFKVTSGVTYNYEIVKGDSLSGNDRTNANVHRLATSSGRVPATAELACLLRKKFSIADMEEMGFTRLRVMHDPIMDLQLNIYNYGIDWLGAEYEHLSQQLSARVGLVFLRP